MDGDKKAPAPVAQGEREALRSAQSAAVMPLIGPLLDAWEGCSQRCREDLPELDRQLRRVNRAMEDAPAPVANPLTDEQIDRAVAAERDALLDHIYDHGTTAEGVMVRVRKLARAAIEATGQEGGAA